jgi:DNA-binding response OmpR family regulator
MENIAFVIEDDEDLSTIFAKALIAAGFQVEIIYDGAIAQQRLAEASPDLVILDMHLPNVDGADLLAQIRADERLKEIPVIITTADAVLGDYHRNTADLVLVKPIAFGQLRDLTMRYKRG